MSTPEDDALVRAVGMIHACARVSRTDSAKIDEHVRTQVEFLRTLDRNQLEQLAYGLAAVSGGMIAGLARILEKFGGYEADEFVDSLVQEALRQTDR